MDALRIHAALSALQGVFWLTLLITTGWCVAWTIRTWTSDDPTEAGTHDQRMLTLYARNAALSGLTCVLALLAWKLR